MFRKDIGQPHNFYLMVAVEMGILGLGILLAIIYTITATFRTVLHNVKDAFLCNCYQGLAAGLVGLLAVAFTAEVFYIFQLMGIIWFMVALLAKAKAMLPVERTDA